MMKKPIRKPFQQLSLALLPLSVLIGGLGVFAPAHSAEKLKSFINSSAGAVYRKLPPAKKGGTINIHFRSNSKTLNPLLLTDADTREIIDYFYAPFLGHDHETWDFYPYLAENLEVSKDRKVMQFTLRKGATWQDGTPITSDDVEFTYQKLMDPKVEAAHLRAYFDGLKFEKVDDRVFRFTVDQPTINTIEQLNTDFRVLQKKQFVNEADFNKSKQNLAPVGSGPYVFKTFSRDQKLEFERRKNWWGDQLPEHKNQFNPEVLSFRIIPDWGLAYEKWIKGELDVFQPTAEQYGVRIMGPDRTVVGKSPQEGKAVWANQYPNSAPPAYTFAGWNMKNPIFASKKVRQALAQLIDYKTINDKIYYGLFTRCNSPFGSRTPNTPLDQDKRLFHLNPQKAMGLLKEEGWADTDQDGVLDKMIQGKKTKFEFSIKFNSENAMRAKIAQILKEQFKKSGILINVQPVEWNALLDDIHSKKFDAVIMGWAKGSLNADAKQLFHTSSAAGKGSNYVSYSVPEVDAMIDDSGREMSPQKRFRILQKIAQKIYDDQPYAYLAEQASFFAAYSKRVKSPHFILKYLDHPTLSMLSVD